MSGEDFARAPLSGWTVQRPVGVRVETLTDPTAYPLTVANLKAHLRIAHATDDAYVGELIATATEITEKYINRSIVARTIRQWMDRTPGYGPDAGWFDAPTSYVTPSYGRLNASRWFELRGLPVTRFDSFQYVTEAGTTQTVDHSAYLVDLADPNMPARVILQRGSAWPSDLQVAQAISCTYRVGYNSGAPAWAASTAYTLGQVVLAGRAEYTCTVPGTSGTTMPTGAGPVVDGGVTWTFSSAALPFPAALVHGVRLVAAALYSNRGDNVDAMGEVLSLPNIRAILDPFRVIRVAT
jgi:hypothetical protein